MQTTIFATLLLTGHMLAGPMTKGERQRLLAHLEMTEQWLADEVSSLSETQLVFKPAAESWSVLNVVEHLSIAEPQYWQWLQEEVKKPLTEKPSETKDEAILWYGIDRTQRSKTAAERTPTGKATDLKATLAAVRKLRGTMLDYARSTEEDLRGRRFKDGNMDIYQWFLMISTHSQRHILQIREIKAHKHFPRK